MKTILRLSFAVLCCATAALAANEKWTDLFNGKDLTGWTQKGG